MLDKKLREKWKRAVLLLGSVDCILHFPGYHRLFVPATLYCAGNCTWKREWPGKNRRRDGTDLRGTQKELERFHKQI